MPIIACPNCGAKTNTAICPGWWDKKNRDKAKCFAKWSQDNGYEKGCGYDTAGQFDRQFADKLINGE